MNTSLLVVVAPALFGVVSPAYSSACDDICGFLYSGGTYTTLSGPPDSINTDPFGINDRGQIVGEYNSLSDPGSRSAFLYSGGAYTTLSVPNFSQPLGINNRGQIVGVYSGTNTGPSPLGFLYSGGTYTTLSTGSVFTVAQGINNRGQIVGGYSNITPEDLGVYAFLRSGGTYTSFGVPGSTTTYASGINDGARSSVGITTTTGLTAFCTAGVPTLP